MPLTLNSTKIPAIHHRIWFGSFLPKTYQDNLVQLVARNASRYLVYLWTDFSTLDSDEKVKFQTFCKLHTIILCDIRAYTKLANYVLITKELDKTIQHANEKNFQPRLHFVRASDLARISILLAFGGVYTDTDTQSLCILPVLDAPFGFLCKKKDNLPKKTAYQLKKTFPDFSDMILYDFIAATPSNPILQITANVSESDYQIYHEIKQSDWEYIDCDEFHLRMTCAFTGSTLRAAINYWTKKEKIPGNESMQLFFNDEPFFLSTYDKSWLSHDIAELDESEALKHLTLIPKLKKILSNFSNNIEKNRNAKFTLPAIVNQLLPNDLDTHNHDNAGSRFNLVPITRKTKQQLAVNGFLVLAVAVGLFNLASKLAFNEHQSLLLVVLGSLLLAGGGYYLATQKQVLYHPGLFATNNAPFTLPICKNNTNLYQVTSSVSSLS